MTFRCTSLAAAALLIAAVTGAMAQQPSPQDHDQHHPADSSGSAAPTPPGGAAGAMAPGGPGMMPMMGGASGGMMMGAGAGMPMMMMMAHRMAEHVEGRLAFLKTELKITEAQAPQWSAFAEAVRANAKAMKDAHPASPQMPTRLPERLDTHEKMLAAHLDAVRKLKAAAAPLYAALSDEQKKSADELILGPMGLM